MNKKIHKNFKRAFGLLVLFVFCLWIFEGRTIVLKIGNSKIYKKDINYRNKINNIKYPDEKEEFGLQQLQKSYINYQILKKYNYTSIDERLKNEADRIDKQTKNPDALKKIKDIFGRDKKAYYRVFVAPGAIDEVIFYDFFPRLESYHIKTQARAEELLSNLKSTNQSLKDLAEKEGLPYRVMQISKAGIESLNPQTLKPMDELASEDIRKSTLENPQAMNWINVILKNLEGGDLIPEIIKSEDLWSVGRLNKKTKERYLVEFIDVPKKTFHEFLEEETLTIPIKKGPFLF